MHRRSLYLKIIGTYYIEQKEKQMSFSTPCALRTPTAMMEAHTNATIRKDIDVMNLISWTEVAGGSGVSWLSQMNSQSGQQGEGSDGLSTEVGITIQFQIQTILLKKEYIWVDMIYYEVYCGCTIGYLCSFPLKLLTSNTNIMWRWLTLYIK